MNEKQLAINPKHAIGILRRYLHVLALLQNNKDPQDWNSNTLADLLSREILEGEPVSDKTIRSDIEKYIEGDLGLSVARKKGGRRMDLAGALSDETLQTLLMTYADFVIHDSSRSRALGSFIAAKRDTCLWLVARIHFAAVTRKKIQFEYTTNSNYRMKTTIHPYHIVNRENRIYLVGMRDSDRSVGPYILSRVENLIVLDAEFDETIPAVDELYRHSLSAFIWDEAVEMKIRYKAGLENNMANEFSSLEPVITKNGDWHEITFLVFDPEAVCRQLFFYGSQVEVVSPPEVREWMIGNLRDALSVYRESGK